MVVSEQLTFKLDAGASRVLTYDAYPLANYLPTYSNEQIKVSKIFYREKGFNIISLLQEDEELDLTPTLPQNAAAVKRIIVEMLTKIQAWLFRRRFPASMLPEFRKRELLGSQADKFSAQKSFASP